MKTHLSRTVHAALLTTGSVCWIVSSANAQEAPTVDAVNTINLMNPMNQTYAAEYFSNFAPQTAFDMVLRTPGFQIQLSENRRGLGQGGTNILLNGQRLLGKSTSPSEQLGRISSERVVRIEVLDGVDTGIPGLSGRVANIVTKKANFSGNWTWSPVFRNYVEPNWGRADLSISGSKNEFSYGLTMRNTSNRLGSRGPEERNFITGETVIVKETFNGTADGPTLSGNLSWTPNDDKTVNFGFEVTKLNANERETSSLFEDTNKSLTSKSSFYFGMDESSSEINGDIVIPLGNGQIKFIGLLSENSSFRRSVSEQVGVSESTIRSQFDSNAFTKETIFRTEYDWGQSERGSWQASGEYVRNTLDFDTSLFKSDKVGVLQPVALEDPNADVAENRYEVALTHDRKVNKNWTFQASVGAEFSEITQSDVNSESSRTFFRPKGFTSASYAPRTGLTYSARIERSIGQLSFLDFTSSVDLEDDLDQTGNPDLVPQQTWRGEFSINRQFSGGHVLDFALYGEDISDLVDRVPIGESGDGIGNIPSARRVGLDASATLKGEGWGWEGFETQIEVGFANSEVKDPLKEFKRQLNNEATFTYDISLTYDRPNSDWGIGGQISETKFAPIYRLRSIDENIRSPFASVYIENKDVEGLKVRASIFNATDFSMELNRQIFDARRDLGVLTITESRQRSFGPFIMFDVSGQF